MPETTYSATDLANLKVCENQHKLRHLDVDTPKQARQGQHAHEKFLEGKHIRKKTHDPDALFALLQEIWEGVLLLWFLFTGLTPLLRVIVLLALIAIFGSFDATAPLYAAAAIVGFMWWRKDHIRRAIGAKKWQKHPRRRFAQEQLQSDFVYVEGKFQNKFREFNRFANRSTGQVTLRGWLPDGTRLSGRPDMILRNQSGELFPVDCKNRDDHKTTARDTAQLSTYRAIMTGNTRIFGGQNIADFGYILFLNSNGFPTGYEQIALEGKSSVQQLATRARELDNGDDARHVSQSPFLCNHCQFSAHCDIRVMDATPDDIPAPLADDLQAELFPTVTTAPTAADTNI